jgi:hypothetical protein
MNLHEYIHMIWYQIIWFIPNLYELKKMCFEFVSKNMLIAVLPQTAAPLDSRTLPRALLDSRTLPLTLPCTAAHTAHTAWIKVPQTAHRTPHTALLSHTAINVNLNKFIWMCMHLHKFIRILFVVWIYMYINMTLF